jgi:hypothetical protein
MKQRLVGIAGAVLVSFVLLAPVVLAASPLPHTGRVLVSTSGDITLPAGEHADVVVVVDGTATIRGEVNTIVVVDGAANLLGAKTETIVAVRSPVELGPGTVVLGDVMTVQSSVHQTGNAQIQGGVTDMATVLVGVGAVLAPALLLIFVGFGLAAIVAGLVLAGLAARQVREAEGLISREPILTLAAGIVGLVVFPVVAILLMATLIGAPLGFGILLGAWPLVAFVGYLVAGIWIGDWLLRRTSPERVRDRPYLAAAIGVLLLQVLAIVPVVTLVVMIASLFGFGSVLVLSIRKLGSRSVSQPTVTGPMSAPIGS